jgi:superfamily II RNA helicase/transcriptional regulator with XRE-family HTH domain
VVADELLETFAREYPFPFDPFQREAIKHLCDDRSVLVAAPTGTGKALEASTPVLTPTGWKAIGELQVGDLVIGASGQPVRVMGVYPQGKRPAYRVTFNDGVSVVCDLDHLWAVNTKSRKHEKLPWRVLTLRQILAEGLSDGQGRRHFIPLVEPVALHHPKPAEAQMTVRLLRQRMGLTQRALAARLGVPKWFVADHEKNRLIPSAQYQRAVAEVLAALGPYPHLPPYLLGALLGDGGFSTGMLRFTSADNELVEKIRALLPPGVALQKAANTLYDWYIVSRPRGTQNPVVAALYKLGLMGHRAEGKFIPHAYKFASVEDRISILQGLLDTDGSIGATGYDLEYITVSSALAEDVAFLVRSLGGRTRIRQKVTGSQLAYRMHISLPGGIAPFSLRRKAERYASHTRYKPYRAITAVEPAGEAEMVCIAVDAPDGLFVVDGFVVTHNTVVAEAGIWLARRQGKRVIYTAPLKALSNQKFRDLRERYGPQAVGLVTGDIVEAHYAPIVVMTTEIYRNMLLEAEARGISELDDVACVIFDELHYVSDPERGPVWEEAIIHSPKHILLVGLSATVSNAEELALWISRVHRPISLVFHTERAIPLEHYYYLDGQLHLVMDADRRRIGRFPKIGGEAKKRRDRGQGRRFTFGDAANEKNGQPLNGQANGQPDEFASPAGATEQAAQVVRPLVIREPDPETRPKPGEREATEPGELLNALLRANLLPCIYFLPGRRIVEETALGVSSQLLVTPAERELLSEEVKAWLGALSPEDRELEQVRRLTALLPRGLAYHHAGLLPGLKVLVETLFQRGHLKAVFATDTLALGINMPARSVVVGSLSKFDGTEMRLLTPNEYQQLTGRAGRRGMDERGAAILPYSPWEAFEPAFAALTGKLLPVNSAFVIRYNSILNLWGEGDVNRLRRVVASSFREFQRYSRHLMTKERQSRRADELIRLAQGEEEEGAGGAIRIEGQKPRRALSKAGAAELYGTIQVLQTLDYISPDDRLTIKGRLLRDIFHPAGILFAELIAEVPLDELYPAEMAELASWFTFDDDRPVRNRNALSGRLIDLRRDVARVVRRVQFLETELGVEVTSGISESFHSLALNWWRGGTLAGLQRRIDLAEGDLLVTLNQTIDLLQQVQSAVGKTLDDQALWHSGGDHNEEWARELEAARLRLMRVRPLLASATKGLLRGIVLQSRTVPSMAVQVAGEQVPLDMEEDEDRRDLRVDLAENPPSAQPVRTRSRARGPRPSQP